jgi:signal transduction histidine kinase
VDTIAADRQGVRGSIVARLERHGGSATVVASPGAGTEIRMEVPR